MNARADPPTPGATRGGDLLKGRPSVPPGVLVGIGLAEVIPRKNALVSVGPGDAEGVVADVLERGGAIRVAIGGIRRIGLDAGADLVAAVRARADGPQVSPRIAPGAAIGPGDLDEEASRSVGVGDGAFGAHGLMTVRVQGCAQNRLWGIERCVVSPECSPRTRASSFRETSSSGRPARSPRAAPTHDLWGSTGPVRSLPRASQWWTALRRATHRSSIQSGQVALLYNGELYDADEHRRELTSRGYRLQLARRREVVLAAYLEWGVRFLREIDGMFALAIVDRREEAARRALANDRARARSFRGKATFIHAHESWDCVRLVRDGDPPRSSTRRAPISTRWPRSSGTASSPAARRGSSASTGSGLGPPLVLQDGGASIYPFAEKGSPRKRPRVASRIGLQDRGIGSAPRCSARARSEVGLGLFLSGEPRLGRDRARPRRGGDRGARVHRRFSWGARRAPACQEYGGGARSSLGFDRARPRDPRSLGIAHARGRRAARRRVGVESGGAGGAGALPRDGGLERRRGDELFGGYRRERAFEMIGRVRVPRVVTGPLSRLRGEPGRIRRALSRAPGIGRYQELRDRVSEGEELLLPPFRRGDAVTEEGLPGSPRRPLGPLLLSSQRSSLSAGRRDDGELARGRAPLLDPDLADFAASLPQKRGTASPSASGCCARRSKARFPTPSSAAERWDSALRSPAGSARPASPSESSSTRGAARPRSTEANYREFLAEHRLGKRDASLVLARAIAVELFRRGL